MGAHHRKAIAELENKLGYERTEDVPDFPVWVHKDHGSVAIDWTSNKAQMDKFMASIRRAHRPLPKPDTDVVPRADQAAHDQRERERRQGERADNWRNRNRLLGGASRGLNMWQLDQLEAATENIIRQDRSWRQLMSHRPHADITD